MIWDNREYNGTDPNFQLIVELKGVLLVGRDRFLTATSFARREQAQGGLFQSGDESSVSQRSSGMSEAPQRCQFRR